MRSMALNSVVVVKTVGFQTIPTVVYDEGFKVEVQIPVFVI